MTKRQTSQDNIFYYQEIAQDILNLSLRFSYQEIGFYLTFKAAYIFHKGKIPIDKLCQFCRIFSEQDSFQNFVKNNFEIVDGFVVSKSFDAEVYFINEKSNERKKAVESRWKNTIVDTNADTIGDTKQETSNKKHQTINNKPKTRSFIVPTLQEIQAYCQERKNSVSAEKFLNYYQAKGWMIGKNKMKDWKAAVRTWEGNDKQPQQTKSLFNPDDWKHLK